MDVERVVALAGVAALAANGVICVVALLVVPHGRRPQTALAWLLAIFFLPLLGLVLFLIVGRARLSRLRRARQATVDRFIFETTEGLDLSHDESDWPSWLRSVTAMNRALSALPLVGGNDARLIPGDQTALDAMTRAVEAATRYVHVEFFIVALDDTTRPFFDALESARRRGVIVRVLIDHLGSTKYPGFRPALRRLTEMGAEWHLMLPFQPLRGRIRRPDLRNHRKLVSIDGELAFTGSGNLIDPGYQRSRQPRDHLRWKDLMARFEGPIVASIEAIFVTDWYMETGELLSSDTSALASGLGGADCQVVPSGPGYKGENNLRLFNRLVYAAQEKVMVTSPYFVPDDTMLYAITTAAQSGIDVQLFVSEVGDQFLVYHAQRSYYQTLLEAGVRIWLYAGPTILHAKHVTVDDEVAVIGSSNMDMRSFSLDLELSVLVRSPGFLAELREVEQRYRDHSRELTLDEWSRRPFVSRAFDDLARLTSAIQ